MGTWGAGSGQPPLTIRVQGKEVGGAEQFYSQLLLRGTVGGLDCNGAELLSGGFCLGWDHRQCQLGQSV